MAPKKPVFAVYAGLVRSMSKTMPTTLNDTDIKTMIEKANVQFPEFFHKIVAIVGGFGSGKTEVAVNLAQFLKKQGTERVTIVDFDLVNPYFRSREIAKPMEDLGIRVVVPTGGQFYADLPILMPEVRGVIEQPDGLVILDIGGDSQGTKALGSLSNLFTAGQYDLLMVINSRRPQTDSVDGCMKTMKRIEETAGLKFTGLISNSHMIDETDAAVIEEGYQLTSEVAKRANLPISFVSALRPILDEIGPEQFDCPVLPLSREMLKPWERGAS